jgi:predicted TIM-barrel fold metal-dependent hydrolase
MAYRLIDRSEGEYWLPRGAYVRDWDAEEIANLMFLETDTDVAVFHPTPIMSFRDGLVAVEKAAEAARRWPQRFISYATVDALGGERAIEELERQVEAFQPIGLKLYPMSWRSGGYPEGFRMDDVQTLFPLYEKARSLGIRSIAVHKAIPLGPVPTEPFKVGDVEAAAGQFPDLVFEIVHGGLAFTEETASMLARFPNVYVNLESLDVILAFRPRRFAGLLAKLLSVSGERGIDKLFWGTGGMVRHPRLSLDAFWNFEIPEDVIERESIVAEIPQLTAERRARILGQNYVEALGLDLERLRAGIADDKFAQQRRVRGDDVPRPWSTTRALQSVTP